MMILATVHDIDWDVDEDEDSSELDLPSVVRDVEVEVSDQPEGYSPSELEEALCGVVSDEYGYCINSFNYTIKDIS